MTNDPFIFYFPWPPICRINLNLLATESKKKCPIKHKNVDSKAVNITQGTLYFVGNENDV